MNELWGVSTASCGKAPGRFWAHRPEAAEKGLLYVQVRESGETLGSCAHLTRAQVEALHALTGEILAEDDERNTPKAPEGVTAVADKYGKAWHLRSFGEWQDPSGRLAGYPWLVKERGPLRRVGDIIEGTQP